METAENASDMKVTRMEVFLTSGLVNAVAVPSTKGRLDTLCLTAPNPHAGPSLVLVA